MRAHDDLLTTVRQAADELDPDDRIRFMRELAREVYDAEKRHGAGGEGLDGRDSFHRQLLGTVTDAAQAAVDAISPAPRRD